MPATMQERANARRRYARALESCWSDATPETRSTGTDWYGAAQDAALELAARYGAPLASIAGAIAALSPRTRWDENLADAHELCRWYFATDDAAFEPLWSVRKRLYAVSMRQVEKAVDCLGSPDPLGEDILRGPKERAFCANILGQVDAVTVDVWITRAATRGALDTPGRAYDDIARAMRTVAARVGAAPRDLQAAVWVQVRGKSD